MERYAADLIARGVDPGEARRRARIEFGSTAAAAEECREAVGLRWPDEFARDLRYAARVLRKSPTFTAAAVATLALCIGANTAIFSVVDAVLLRPLPYPQPERLFSVARHFQGKGSEATRRICGAALGRRCATMPRYVDAAVFSDGSMGVNFAAGGRVEYVKQQRVSAGFFRVLGIAPLIGREFSADEDRPGGPAVTVLSYALWKRVFRGDPSIVGQAVTLRGEPYTVVGVLPANFQSSVPADLWTPLRPSRYGRRRRIQLCRRGPLAFRRDMGAGQRADRSDRGAALACVWAGPCHRALRLISFQRGLTEYCAPAAADSLGGGGIGIADRLREYRRTAAGAGRRPHARDGHPHGAGQRARRADPANAGRERRAGTLRRRRRSCPRMAGSEGPQGPDAGQLERLAGRGTGLARAGRHGWRVDRGGHPVRLVPRAGRQPPGDPRGAGRGGPRRRRRPESLAAPVVGGE